MTMTLVEVMAQYGEFAHGGDVEGTAQEWADAGFTAQAAAAWLDAECFTAYAARRLADAGVTPTQAAVADSEACGYAATIGYKIANGDMDIEDINRE